MNNNDYASSEFYSYKFRNFSTMIILPMAILVVLIFIGSFFAVRQTAVNAQGIVEPAQVLNIKNQNYHEGQIINKNKQKWWVHLDNKRAKVVHLMPIIKRNQTVRIMLYIPSNEISTIQKRQTVNFQLANAQSGTKRITGVIKSVGVYPVNMRNTSFYEVVCDAKVNNREQIKYGMQVKAAIITGKNTYFNYFKDKVLSQDS